MTVIIYTHPPDYLMAGTSARFLAAQGFKVVLAIDQGDPPFACEFAKVIRTSFERKGNLNGLEFMQGHLRLMDQEASGAFTFKGDSDTAMLDPRRLIDGRTEVAVGLYVAGMSGMNGCCYALRTDALPAMIAEAGKLSPRQWLMEDQTTGRLAEAVGPVHFEQWGEVTLYDRWRPETAPEWYREHKAVVCFEAKEDSNRREIARQMRRLYEL